MCEQSTRVRDGLKMQTNILLLAVVGIWNV